MIQLRYLGYICIRIVQTMVHRNEHIYNILLIINYFALNVEAAGLCVTSAPMHGNHRNQPQHGNQSRDADVKACLHTLGPFFFTPFFYNVHP